MAETDLVINEGQTISASMREHLETINHQEAIEFIKTGLKTMRLLVNQTLPYILSFWGILPKESWPLSLCITTIKDKFSPCEPAAIHQIKLF
jgi:hypothetical protein